MDRNREQVLLCRVGELTCALPIEDVCETMRPLPVEPLSATVPFVLGLSTIRGGPVPVVDAARILGAADAPAPSRFVTVRAGHRRVALALSSVIGVRRVPPSSRLELPPLLKDAATDVIASIAALDADLLLVLEGGRLVPDSLWAALDAPPVAP